MTSQNDFDIAKAVMDQLKELDAPRQERILRWVAESLGLKLSGPQVQTATTGEHPGARSVVPTPALASGPTAADTTRSTNIKSFVELKQPKSDVQFVAVVAYYYRFESPMADRRDTIGAKLLEEAARLAGRRRPPEARITLNNAKRLGYVDGADRGQFRINSVGENLVAMTLPGNPSKPVAGRRKKAKTVKRKRK